MGEIVHGIDDPVGSGPEVGLPFDAVHDRVPHHDIGGGHVDFGPEDIGPIGEFAGPHPGKEVEIFLVNNSEILWLG